MSTFIRIEAEPLRAALGSSDAFFMGAQSEVCIYFTPATAKQWIETLSKYVEREQ